jgi:O-antigen/teichoic acid export membrane protein
LSREEYGQYTYLTSFVYIFSALATLGLPTYMSREIAQQPERASLLLKTSYILELILSFLTVGFILFLGHFSQTPISFWLLFLSALGMVTSATSGLFQYSINGLNRSYITAAIQLFTSCLNSGSLLLAIFFSPNLTTLIWIFALSGILQHLLTLFCFRYFFRDLRAPKKMPSFADFKEVFVNSLPYVFLLAFTAIYFRIDIVLLERWGTLEQIADYSAAYKFIDIIQLIVGLIGGVFFAEFSNMQARNEKGIDDVLKRGFRYMLLISLPFASLLTFYAKDLLYLFFGQKYLQSTAILQTLGWTTVFLFASNLQAGLIQSRNYVRIQVLVFGFSSVLNILLNYYLIPSQGALGSAVATLICECFNFLAFTSFLYKQFQISLIERWLLPTALAFVAMNVALWFCTSLPALLGIIVGLSVFIIVFGVFGGIQTEDLALVRQGMSVFSRKSQ